MHWVFSTLEEDFKAAKKHLEAFELEWDVTIKIMNYNIMSGNIDKTNIFTFFHLDRNEFE